jgi:hypothetical protein
MTRPFPRRLRVAIVGTIIALAITACGSNNNAQQPAAKADLHVLVG